jgi:hypothetical protein
MTVLHPSQNTRDSAPTPFLPRNGFSAAPGRRRRHVQVDRVVDKHNRCYAASSGKGLRTVAARPTPALDMTDPIGILQEETRLMRRRQAMWRCVPL